MPKFQLILPQTETAYNQLIFTLEMPDGLGKEDIEHWFKRDPEGFRWMCVDEDPDYEVHTHKNEPLECNFEEAELRFEGEDEFWPKDSIDVAVPPQCTPKSED